MMRRVIAVVGMLVLALAVPARADLMISFSADGSPVDFSVVVGQTVDVPVYVWETDGTLLTDWGLFSAGVQIRYAETGTNASVNDVNTDVILAPYWSPDVEYKAVGNDALGNYVEMASGIPFGSPLELVKGNPILIGTVTFTGNVAGDVTQINSGHTEYFGGGVSEPLVITKDPNNGFIVLDDDVFATIVTARIFTTPVPEPSSIVLAISGCAIMGFVVVARRRRRSR